MHWRGVVALLLGSNFVRTASVLFKELIFYSLFFIVRYISFMYRSLYCIAFGFEDWKVMSEGRTQVLACILDELKLHPHYTNQSS
jgi:hypothetical protein